MCKIDKSRFKVEDKKYAIVKIKGCMGGFEERVCTDLETINGSTHVIVRTSKGQQYGLVLEKDETIVHSFSESQLIDGFIKLYYENKDLKSKTLEALREQYSKESL